MMKLLITALLLASVSAKAETLCDVPENDAQMLKNFPELSKGEGNWLFRSHDLLTRFGPKRVGMEGLDLLNQALLTKGTTLVMVPVPTRALVHAEKLGSIDYDVRQGFKAYSSYLDRLRALGIVVPHLELLVSDTDIHKQPLFFARDHHWTPAGAQDVAKLVAGEIKEQALVDDAVTRYTTTQLGEDRNPGSYTRAAKKLCDVHFESEMFSQFQTEGALDLFGDAGLPDVVLVGTSNSNGAMDFNFAGFLQEYLGHEVANLARSGGGYDGAILDYLASEAFEKNPPALLIWEVPGYYSLNTPSFYEALLASVGGEK